MALAPRWVGQVPTDLRLQKSRRTPAPITGGSEMIRPTHLDAQQGRRSQGSQTLSRRPSNSRKVQGRVIRLTHHIRPCRRQEILRRQLALMHLNHPVRQALRNR
ncbi:hypothetical protein A5666_17680 [Mycolicibacterium fortuitum]|nr:hypothetical protein A5665_03410 [Mycolicibacterium fortuitum]OBI59431.1 hypothetical protein A5666_17680 [Mycolicibacterium fortuitum]